MAILLTGSSGFIGSYIVNNPRITRVAIRESDKATCHHKSQVLIDSLSGSTDWKDAFDGIDVVVHLAGLAHSNQFSEKDYEIVNVQGTLNLAKQAIKSGVRRFVFVSSIGVNGLNSSHEPFSFAKRVIQPRNLYTASKYNAECGLVELSKQFGLEVVIVRPTLVYGPDAPGNFGMLTKLVKKLLLLPFGLAYNRRDFIAVQNLADLLICCATHPDAAGHTFLASDGETVSIKEFTNAIAKGLGKKVIQIPIPVSLMRFIGKLAGRSAMVEQLFGNLEVDSSNIQQVLGWKPPLRMEQAMATLRDSGTK